jgi:hypothetical protein
LFQLLFTVLPWSLTSSIHVLGSPFTSIQAEPTDKLLANRIWQNQGMSLGDEVIKDRDFCLTLFTFFLWEPYYCWEKKVVLKIILVLAFNRRRIQARYKNLVKVTVKFLRRENTFNRLKAGCL